MPDCLFYHKGKKTQHSPLFFLTSTAAGKEKANDFIVAFLCLRYVFPFKDYRKRFMSSVADSGSSLSETVKFTLCLEENASRAVRNSSALAASLPPMILYRPSMKTRVIS